MTTVITLEEILYNFNLIVNFILVPISLLACRALAKHARITYRHLKSQKEKPFSLEVKYAIYNLRTVYVRDLFLCFISFDEGIQKFLEIIDYILLQIRDAPDVLSLNISNSCAINPVSSLGFYYHRGPGYYFLFALINTTDMLLLVFLNALTLFLIKSYSEHPQWRSLKLFIFMSMVLTFLTLIITPIQYTLILGNVAYGLFVLVQLLVLIALTKRMYLVLRQRKLEALCQKLAPRVIQEKETLQQSYKYFSIAFIVLLVVYLSGQWLEILLVTVIGSFLENSCWFGVYFNAHFSIPYSPAAFEPVKLFAIYFQFVSMLIMNGAILILYCSFLAYYVCYQGWIRRRINRTHYTTAERSLDLEASLID